MKDFTRMMAISVWPVAVALSMLMGCTEQSNTNNPPLGEDTGADLDTDTDTDADTDTDSDADGEVDTGTGNDPAPVGWELDYEALEAAYEYNEIERSWLTGEWEGVWPNPENLPIQVGLCTPNYDPNFWTHLACFNEQTDYVDPFGTGSNHTCYAHLHAEPPMGTPFSCDMWMCQFFQNIGVGEMPATWGGYNYRDMCQDSEWTCDQCFNELYYCLLDAVDECPDITDGPKIYQQKDKFHDCYLEVTGFDRCRFIFPEDACEGIAECSGPEWPPYA